MNNGTVATLWDKTPGTIQVGYRPEWCNERVIAGASVSVGSDDAGRAKQRSDVGAGLAFSRFIIDRVTRDASRWVRHTSPDFRVFVGVAARDLASTGFVRVVRQALHESALPPATLVLRRTASGDRNDCLAATLDAIDELHGLGLSVIINNDDDDMRGPRPSPPGLTAEDFTRLVLRAELRTIDEPALYV